MNIHALQQLTSLLADEGVKPILVGDRVDDVQPAADNLVEFHLEAPFRRDPLQQMRLLSWICAEVDVRFSIGMKSGGMDGLAFTRELPTYYVGSPVHNGRMDKVSRAFPAFRLIPVSYEGAFASFSAAELEFIRELAS